MIFFNVAQLGIIGDVIITYLGSSLFVQRNKTKDVSTTFFDAYFEILSIFF
jgi:hypothetical protein